MIYVLIAHGFEEIEALATVDILRRAELNVKTVGIGSKVVTGAHKITIACDIEENEVDMANAQMIVLPGGMPGTLMLEKSQEVQNILEYAIEHDLFIGAICAAPSILGHKGYLNNIHATCYPGFEDQLFGAIITNENVCVDGKIITANGPHSAIDFALKLVECLISQDRAKMLRASL